MPKYVPTKHHLREALLFCFNQKKTAAESYRLLQKIYPKNVPTQKTCRWWFARFKSGDFDIEDKERPGQLKKFKSEDLQALLNQDSCQTQHKLANTLGVTQQAISNRLKALGMIQSQGNKV